MKPKCKSITGGDISVYASSESVLPRKLFHLDAVYNLAYWLRLGDQDASEVVFEVYNHAFQVFGAQLQRRKVRTWLLRAVHDTCYARLEEDGRHRGCAENKKEFCAYGNPISNLKEDLLPHNASRQLLQAMGALPITFREVLILRELERLSHEEIAEVVGVPVGCILLQLEQARRRLIRFLCRSGELDGSASVSSVIEMRKDGSMAGSADK